ncbi:MAG: bile acid:sodium symporter [Sphingobacteriia bacterium]|nr:bile acid:sodium symporter [Sphingobacteriia bacterium]
MSLLPLLKRVGLNGFFLALIGTVVLARLIAFTQVANWLPTLDNIADIGVSLVFFFYGLKLNRESLIKGLNNYKIHIVVQLSTFLLFPMLILTIVTLTGRDMHDYLWLGIFYLAALPSTVSSSVVMVSIAGGNIPAAIFNASISSIAGIFITPLWMSLWIEPAGVGGGLGEVFVKLSLQVLLPVILGFVLNRKWGWIADKNRKHLQYFDQFVILLIVLNSFMAAFGGRLFDHQTVGELLVMGLAMLTLFFLVFFLMNILSRWVGLNREDRITVLFCGSKKSLVQGAVMGKVLFVNPAMMAAALVPVMVYHALQLLAGSSIAQRMGNKVKAENSMVEG